MTLKLRASAQVLKLLVDNTLMDTDHAFRFYTPKEHKALEVGADYAVDLKGHHEPQRMTILQDGIEELRRSKKQGKDVFVKVARVISTGTYKSEQTILRSQVLRPWHQEQERIDKKIAARREEYEKRQHKARAEADLLQVEANEITAKLMSLGFAISMHSEPNFRQAMEDPYESGEMRFFRFDNESMKQLVEFIEARAQLNT